MRIISGSARGREIKSPKNAARPMRDKVRGAMFNIIGKPEEENLHFLDLFAGTGAVGLEALSRGFDYATFVELTGLNCKLIKENIKNIGFELDNCKVVKQNVFYFLKAAINNDSKYDIVFAGTPYIDEVVEKLFDEIESLKSIVKEDGILIIQTHTRAKVPQIDNIEKRVFGDDTLYFWYK